MKPRAAIAQFEATVVLVVISLSLASIVYTGLRRESGVQQQPVFANQVTPIGGVPAIERLVVSSSSAITLSSLSVDEASSADGIIGLNGSKFATSSSLCTAGITTFFSVFAGAAGVLQVSTDGQPWVSGSWGSAVAVLPGWHELMISNGVSCTITLPGGQILPQTWNASSAILSSLPIEGGPSGTEFAFFLPGGTNSHRLLITSTGGFDQFGF